MFFKKYNFSIEIVICYIHITVSLIGFYLQILFRIVPISHYLFKIYDKIFLLINFLKDLITKKSNVFLIIEQLAQYKNKNLRTHG